VLVLIHGLRAEYSAATNAFDQALALPPVTSFLAQGLAYTDAVTSRRETGLPFFLAQSMAQLSLAKFFAGNWGSARTIADEAGATELPGAFAGPAAGLLLGLPAYAGDRERVLQLADRSSGAKGFSTMVLRVTPNGASWSESAQ
jgi:hypothetical protein